MSLSIKEYLRRGPATSREIQAATGLSQTVVARQLRGMGSYVIKLPGGRSPQYAITCNAFGGDDTLPLIVVDRHGNTVVAARIRPLAQGGFFVEPEMGMPSVLLGEGGKGLYDDLPYFLRDLSPRGFLGRQIAKEIASQSSDFPPDPRYWNTHHVGRYLISNGDDLPGNFKFGQQALLRVRRKPAISSVKDYPVLADNVMKGIIPASSAGGEQPKFTTFCGDCSAHVIVKFSPKGNHAVAWRWRDILITEYHATKVMRVDGFPAAETRLFEMEGRLFLESQRFDRIGEYGRESMLSLQMIDAEFTGLGSDWPRVMIALYCKSLVSWQHVFDVIFLWSFGRLINNTDMHLGNLSLEIKGNVFGLLPVYDMCSMGFAPKSGGEVMPYDFMLPDITVSGLSFEEEFISGALGEKTISGIKKMAHDFWARVASDERVSDELRKFLAGGNLIDLME